MLILNMIFILHQNELLLVFDGGMTCFFPIIDESSTMLGFSRHQYRVIKITDNNILVEKEILYNLG